MLLKLAVILIMVIGLYSTLFPRIPGTVIILFGSILYGFATDFMTYQTWILYVLISLVLIAEVGGRSLRKYLTQHERVTRSFSTDTTAGNLGGLIVSDAILGPVAGTILWELIVGKNLLPRWTTVARVLKRLALVAFIRFTCANIIIFLTIRYIFI
ncbi:DUF456 family protein [Dendrosporobacter sp. 1207_IL3150]|uniref:DUF456 family protein n=1 Tax=Dendrosporobacter sp. 1207_IL3150 TaxID=3084054 RepID=UPI002FDA0168